MKFDIEKFSDPKRVLKMMTDKRFLLFVIAKKVIVMAIIALFFSCRNSSNAVSTEGEAHKISHSKWFTIKHQPEYDIIEVLAPWDSLAGLHRYVLVPKSAALPDSLPSGTLVRTPVERIAASNAVQCAIIDRLGCSKAVVAVCEPQYISLSAIKDGVKSGSITDMGLATMPSSERIISSRAEAIAVSPYQNQSYGGVEKIGIPILESAEYMESTPLGQTEWIKFYGAMLGKLPLADSLFNDIETKYKAVCDSVITVTKSSKRPKVIVEKRYSGVWYVSGGGSYAAKFIADAGGDYPWKDNDKNGSLALSFENVFEKASDAKVWLMRYNDPNHQMTYNDLASEYEHYKEFDAFKNHSIYACNTGVINYYETAILNPDIILKDFAKIFHPSLFPNYTTVYYKKLSE